MDTVEIKDFETLIKPYLNSNQKYISYDSKYLLPPGENYGSTLLQISVKVKNGKSEEEIIQCVGKTCPPSEFLWEFFCTKQTFKKEVAFYSLMVPEINAFAEGLGVKDISSSFAKCLGARMSLDPSKDEVDGDAFLILENLKVQQYEMVDRFVGFNLECSKFLLKDLAVMHASAIAYKFAKPQEFQKMLPYLKKDYVFYMQDDLLDDYIKSIQDSLRRDSNCIKQFSKIDKAIRDMKYFVDNPPKGREIFTTLSHNDYWTNNTMIKFENGKPIDNKIIDFQLLEYNSLAHDVIFFLYSSVEMDVLDKHVDELMHFYYDKFIETLVSLKHDISDYSFEILNDEFGNITRDVEFSHLLYMVIPINTSKGKAKDLDQFSKKDFFYNPSSLNECYFRRVQFFLLDFVKRGWI